MNLQQYKDDIDKLLLITKTVETHDLSYDGYDRNYHVYTCKKCDLKIGLYSNEGQVDFPIYYNSSFAHRVSEEDTCEAIVMKKALE